MVDFKKVKAPNNTITRNPAVLAAKADNNIYEAVAIIAKRSNQIAVEMKEELSRKLQEFASYTEKIALNSDFNVQFCKCTNVPIIRRIHWYIFS